MDITLRKDLPGIPSGTIFTQDKDGIFRNGNAWFTQHWMDEHPDKIEKVIDANVLYFYLTDDGQVGKKNWLGDKEDLARKSFGNFFLTEDEALKALENFKGIVK